MRKEILMKETKRGEEKQMHEKQEEKKLMIFINEKGKGKRGIVLSWN